MNFLASVNVGIESVVDDVATGIYKVATEETIKLERNGLVNDVVSDRRHHGGPDQALYVYGSEDYLWWNEELNVELTPGTFGDNLTIANLSSRDVSVGDRFVLEHVTLEATAPRIPCATLGRRMDDARFPLKFRKAGRPGFYCRVLKEGWLKKGMPVEHVRTSNDEAVTVLDMFHLYYDPAPSAETLNRFLKSPIAIRDRDRLRAKLKKLHDRNA